MTQCLQRAAQFDLGVGQARQMGRQFRDLFGSTAALALVALWQGALSLVTIDAERTIGALLDPFANAPVLALTAHWSEGARTTRTVPIDTLLLANRALWLTVAALVVGMMVLTDSGRRPSCTEVA